MYDVGIIGCGPAGIFTALELLKNKPNLKIIMFDRGKSIKTRNCPKAIKGECAFCKPCNISCGFGGAGAFSDGKLSLSKDVGGWLEEYLGTDKINEMIKYVDNIYLNFGANKEVEYNAEFADEIDKKCKEIGLQFVKCPIRHLGTEKCALIMEAMYNEISKHDNVSVLHNTDIISTDISGNLKTITTSKETYEVKILVYAVGRSGADWLLKECKKNKINILNNQVDLGVRVELPREITDPITDKLYEFKVYNLSRTCQNKVRTFCMSPGGFVAQENYDGDLVCVNGHSYKDKKSNLTNFALLVSSRFTEPFDDPIEYGRYIAKLSNMLTKNKVMVQRLCDLKMGKRSTKERIKLLSYTPSLTDAEPGDLSFVIPHRIMNALLETFEELEKLCPGISSDETILYGIEVKFYSAKVKVDNNLKTEFDGVYAIGDGAGITRGLMQSSISGVVAAQNILNIIK